MPTRFVGILPTLNRFVTARFSQYPIVVQTDTPKKSPVTRFQFQPGIECHITRKGRGAFYLNGELYIQEERHVVIFNGRTPHQVFADLSSGYERSVVCLDHRVVDSFFGREDKKTVLKALTSGSEGLVLNMSPQDWEHINHLIQLATMKYERQCQHSNTDVDHVVFQLLTVVLERGESASVANLDSLPGRCIRLIRDHIDQHLSLGMLADMLYVSPKHLSRTFSATVGMTLSAYINFERIKLARRLLRRQHHLTMAGIAMRTGFKSQSHFSIVFRRYTGITPIEYRHRLK